MVIADFLHEPGPTHLNSNLAVWNKKEDYLSGATGFRAAHNPPIVVGRVFAKALFGFTLSDLTCQTC